jgi:uncharacterized protein (TIGR03437 family)
MQAYIGSLFFAAIALLPLSLQLPAADFREGTVPAVFLQGLPSGATPTAIAVDPSGSILMCGYIAEPSNDQNAHDAFVARFLPGGHTLAYVKTLGGSLFDQATAVAADSDGNAYVAGVTASQDFPTTSGAWQTANYPDSYTSFVTKVDPAGNIVYSTLAGGKNYARPYAIAVNSAGEAFVTGQTTGGDFPLTGGSLTNPFPPNSYFLFRLSATADRAIYSVNGPGGTSIALDEQNNSYIAGVAQTYQVPLTANALQKSVGSTSCGGGAQLQIPCQHQYVCKVDATASRLFFCTMLSGKGGESAPSIAIDSAHDIYLTGTTAATDYPVTPGALQSANQSQLPPTPLNPPTYPGAYFAFQPTGYFSRLSGDGSRLLYSTYLGGSQADSPQGLAVDAEGSAYISAVVKSPDYPGLPAGAVRCLPNRTHAMPVLTLLNGAGAHSVVLEGPQAGALLAYHPQGGLWMAGPGAYLNHLGADGAPPPDAISCMTDALDFTQAAPIAPSQLLTIFGAIPENPSVQIDGVDANVTFASATQVNFQVPAALAGNALTDVSLSASHRTVPTAPLSPSLLTAGTDDYPTCHGETLVNGSTSATYIYVLNEDGTPNSCDNPASAGSRIQVVVNGAGTQKPTITDRNRNNTVTAVEPFAGAWLVRIQVAASGGAFTTLDLEIDGQPARQQIAAVWLSK